MREAPPLTDPAGALATPSGALKAPLSKLALAPALAVEPVPSSAPGFPGAKAPEPLVITQLPPAQVMLPVGLQALMLPTLPPPPPPPKLPLP